MPRMDGVETLRGMREICPDLPVVLCSGYPEREAMERFGCEGVAGFLEKPYRPDDLLELIHRAIGQTEAGA
jgi:DNA-binding NtrC family response regulator